MPFTVHELNTKNACGCTKDIQVEGALGHKGRSLIFPQANKQGRGGDKAEQQAGSEDLQKRLEKRLVAKLPLPACNTHVAILTRENSVAQN